MIKKSIVELLEDFRKRLDGKEEPSLKKRFKELEQMVRRITISKEPTVFLNRNEMPDIYFDVGSADYIYDDMIAKYVDILDSANDYQGEDIIPGPPQARIRGYFKTKNKIISDAIEATRDIAKYQNAIAALIVGQTYNIENNGVHDAEKGKYTQLTISYRHVVHLFELE